MNIVRNYSAPSDIRVLWFDIKNKKLKYWNNSRWVPLGGFSDDTIKSIALSYILENSIQKGSLGKINGQSLESGNNISIDLSMYKISSSLPTSNIDSNKIYLVKNSETESGSNVYTEYLYVDGSWESLGSYKTDVDIDGIQKKIEDLDTIRAGAKLGETSLQPDALEGYIKNSSTDDDMISILKEGVFEVYSDEVRIVNNTNDSGIVANENEVSIVTDKLKVNGNDITNDHATLLNKQDKLTEDQLSNLNIDHSKFITKVSETLTELTKTLIDTINNTTDDAARYNWGGSWRMPTSQELDELFELDFVWTLTEGKDGYATVTANENSIILPTNGEKYTEGDSNYIEYTSSNLMVYANERCDGNHASCTLSDGILIKEGIATYRYTGHSIRPVIDKNPTTEQLNGHVAVDLGLSVLWSDRDLGANTPYEKGLKYKFGEVNPSIDNSLNTYKYYDAKTKTYTKYVTLSESGIIDNLNTLTIGDYYTIEQVDKMFSNVYTYITQLQEQIKELQAKVLGTGDTTEEIDTVPEILNFLKGYNNTQTLINTDSSNVSAEDTSSVEYNDVF